MSELAQLKIGARPWLPTDSSEVIETYDTFDIPTSGLIDQSGHYFLFECLEGHVMRHNIWLYAHVTESDLHRLEAAAGGEFVRVTSEIFCSRPIMVGMAIDGRLRAGTPIQQSEIEERGLTQAVLNSLDSGTRASTQATEALEQLVGC